jgi:outer membrane lipoprotein-sorting protein
MALQWRAASLVAISVLTMISSTAFAGKAASGGGAPSPDMILQRADDVRNPSESFSMRITVTTDGQNSTFDVKTKGKDRTLVETVAPARDRGRKMLMIDTNMWAYVPNLKRSVRINLNQKLTGQAANGDIARTRWAGDYDVALESQSAESWVLFLTAQKKGLTYDKIRVWIEKGSFRPIKAEYLAVSGKVIKKAEYGDYREIAGGVRPTKMQISDVADKEKSILTIEEMKKAEFADSVFNQNNMD